MTLWARKDVQSISIPVTSGGCGQAHSRGSDLNGYPNVMFELNCPGCENFLKGGGRTVLQVTPGDAKAGIPTMQERVAVIDPCWASDPAEVPPTSDEVRRERKFSRQVMLEQNKSLAAGLKRLLEGDADSSLLTRVGRSVPGVVLCPQNHSNMPGSRFCGQCGAGLSVHTEIGGGQ